MANHIKNTLEKIAADVCERNGLTHAYFSQKFGQRKHFLAGYGMEIIALTHHNHINDRIVFSWQGTMNKQKAKRALEPFTDLINEVSQELA